MCVPANSVSYLEPVLCDLARQWPDNEAVQLVCHGHSVPSGYFATPFVNSFDSYPHLLHRIIKERFPFAVVNVIVTAIGGENSESGLERFDTGVLNHNPRVIMIDYGLNDRWIGLERSEASWRGMIEKALSRNVKVILLTPSWDTSYFQRDENWDSLVRHGEQIRRLSGEYGIGLADTFARFREEIHADEDLVSLLSHGNHPNRKGHTLIADELGKFFLAK